MSFDVALAFTRGHMNQLRGLSLPCAGAVFSMEIEGDDAELEDDGPPEDDGLAEPSLGSMASIISINGCGRRATAVTSRWTTASQASPIRMDWTNRSRSATGCAWGWCDENAGNARTGLEAEARLDARQPATREQTPMRWSSILSGNASSTSCKPTRRSPSRRRW